MSSTYIIELITNMHVGSGDISSDIIDNKVQKDITTNLPVIHSSSLKGALREHFEKKWGKDDDKIVHIFGKEGEDGSAGNYDFFEAQILTLPQRSNVKPYFNTTSLFVIKNLIEKMEIFDKDNQTLKELKTFYEKIKSINKGVIFEPNLQTPIYLEDLELQKLKNIKLPSIFKNLALINDMDFIDIELPVVARNALDENGISQNLWYEEIVPKKSTFFFNILKDGEYVNEFEKVLEEDIIQIGANKSIGYGFCKIRRV